MDTSKFLKRYFLSFDPTVPPNLNASPSDIAYNNGELYYFNGTTWISLTAMPDPPLGGDLSGFASNATVVGIQGISISNTAPTNGQVIAYDGAQYIPTTLPGPPILTTMANLPNPDTLTEGQIVIMSDESPFVGIVARRPYLELNGSQRYYYLQLVSAGFNWRYNAGAATTADRFGRYDPITNLVYPITSLTDIPNCTINASVAIGAPVTIQRVGRPASQPTLAAGQTLVAGQRLTWNASGQVVAWTPASTTAPIGFFQSVSAAPGGGSMGMGWTCYIPFI